MKSIFTFLGIVVVMIAGAIVLYANGASESAYWIFGIILGAIICLPSSKRKKE